MKVHVSPYTPPKYRPNFPQFWLTPLVMNNNTFHPRNTTYGICDSPKNHGDQHRPRDTGGESMKKYPNTCLPVYQEKDRNVKFENVANKLNQDFLDRKKSGQCFPKKK